jgi:hypothetical protein
MAQKASLDVNGDTLLRNMEKHGREFIEAAKRALRNFERIEMKEMKKRTPRETGELEESGFEGEPVVTGTEIRAVMGFTAPHATVVHEDLEAFHSKGQAKYMSSVIDESGPHMLERVAEDMKKDLGT